MIGLKNDWFKEMPIARPSSAALWRKVWQRETSVMEVTLMGLPALTVNSLLRQPPSNVTQGTFVKNRALRVEF